MAMRKVLHAGDDRDRLYVSRKGLRGFVSIEHCAGALIQALKDYIKRAKKD